MELIIMADSVPDEILLQILNYLRLPELCRCCLVCKRWNMICRDKSLWRTIHLELKSGQNQPEDVLSSIIRHHPYVQCLVLSYSNLEVDGKSTELNVNKKTWEKFKHLEDLYMKGTPPSTLEQLKAIQTCHTLKRLRIEGSESFHNRHFIMLADSGVQLQELSLAHCRFLDGLGMFNSCLNYTNLLCCLKSLQVLNIDGISDISDAQLRKLFVASPQLKALTIDGENITDSTPKNIAELLPLLHRLSISFCHSLTNKALACFAQLRYLEALYLKKNENFTSIGFMPIAKRQPLRLASGEMVGVRKELSVVNCPGFEDKALTLIAELSPELKYLDISWCYYITDFGLYSISQCCRKIHTLKIVGLFASVIDIIENPMPTLRILDLEQSGTVDDAKLVLLKTAKPWMDITDYYGQKICNYM